MKGHNTNLPQVSEHLLKILITGGTGLGKANTFLKLMRHQPDIDKTYL